MSWSRTIRWGLLIAAIGVAGYFGWQKTTGEHAVQVAQKAPAPKAVPVKIAAVEKADFPVYLTGLSTVLVRTRVDGQINKIDFTEGQFVKEGDTLVEIDPRPFQATLDQAKAKKAQDEANLANAKLDLQRFTRLGEFATRQQTDTQRSQVAQLTAQIEADQAAIDNAQTQLDYATVKAPISGIVGIRQVDVGNIVNAATQTGIVSIAQIEPIAMIFTAPEDQLPDIKAALAASPPKVIALSTDGKKALSTGTLALINNQVDTTSGTIRLKAVFDNKDHALWPGQSVSTRLLVATHQGDKIDRRPLGGRRRPLAGRAGNHIGPIQGAAGHAGQQQCRGCDSREGRPGMIGGISAPFIRYPIGTSLLMAGILFVGLVAYPLL